MSHLESAKQEVIARLDRARNIHQVLDEAISNYANFDIDTVKSYVSLVGRTELKLVIPPMPQEWGFLASEILHHTRSALDNSLVAVAEHRSESKYGDWKPSFPLSKSNEYFNKYGIKRNLQNVDPELIEIVRCLQPFSFEGSLPDSLKSLATLNNADKHSSLSVVGAVFKDPLRISEIGVWFQGGHSGATINGHETGAGKMADGHTIISVDTNPPHKEAHFASVKFVDHQLKFDTVIGVLPSFTIDHFAPAINDAEKVCRTLFDAQ